MSLHQQLHSELINNNSSSTPTHLLSSSTNEGFLDMFTKNGPSYFTSEKRCHYLEINLDSDEREAFPLMSKKSSIYKREDIFVIENVFTLKALKKKLQKWFEINSEINTEEKFLLKDKNDAKYLSTDILEHGYLLLNIHKRAYYRINVIIIGNFVRIPRLEDYINLKECLDLIFEINPSFKDKETDQKFIKRNYQEFLDCWRSEEAYHQKLNEYNRNPNYKIIKQNVDPMALSSNELNESYYESLYSKLDSTEKFRLTEPPSSTGSKISMKKNP